MFCALIAALSIAVMLLSSLVPMGTFALPMLAGALLVAAVIEYGAVWGVITFAVSAVLSFLLAGDKEAALYFALFFGYYPVVKQIFESKIKKSVPRVFLKFAVFNAAMVSAFFIASFVLSVPAEEYTVFGFYVPYLFLLAGNFVFLFYDRALTLFVVFYVKRIRSLFGKKF